MDCRDCIFCPGAVKEAYSYGEMKSLNCPHGYEVSSYPHKSLIRPTKKPFKETMFSATDWFDHNTAFDNTICKHFQPNR